MNDEGSLEKFCKRSIVVVGRALTTAATHEDKEREAQTKYFVHGLLDRIASFSCSESEPE